MESRPTQAVLPLVGLAADKLVRDRYIFQAVGFFRGGKPPDASRPPVGRTRGGQSRPRPVYKRHDWRRIVDKLDCRGAWADADRLIS
ncbi:MAG: hypothetical protein ACQESR_26990 [Planctomycetota bacterium]